MLVISIIATAHNTSIHTCNQFTLSHSSKLQPLKIIRQPNNPPTKIQTKHCICLSIDVIFFLDHTAETATGNLNTPSNWRHTMKSYVTITFKVVPPPLTDLHCDLQ